MVYIPANSIAGLTGGTQLSDLLLNRLRGEGLGVPSFNIEDINRLEQAQLNQLINEQIRPEIAQAGGARGIGGVGADRASILTDILTRRLGEASLGTAQAQAQRRLQNELLKRQELQNAIGSQLNQQQLEAGMQRAASAAELQNRQQQLGMEQFYQTQNNPWTQTASVLGGIGGGLSGLGSLTGFLTTPFSTSNPWESLFKSSPNMTAQQRSVLPQGIQTTKNYNRKSFTFPWE